MANWQNLSIKDAIVKIKNEEIVLPVIQRRLVWSEDKMEMLFDSLLKENSFGSIICIEEEKDRKPLFAFRRFTQDGRDVASSEVDKLSKTQWFIIDGQQRLQTFYIGLLGTINGKRLFFDLYSDFEEGDYDFKFAINANDLPRANKERVGSTIYDCLWYPVDDLYQRLSEAVKMRQVAKEIINCLDINESIKIDCIEANIQDFTEAVFTHENIGISRVLINKTKGETENKQRIVELFKRLNGGGTVLSSYDLVASMFKGFDYKMESFLDSVIAENSDIGIDQDVLIKLLLILNDKPSNEMSDLTAKDAEFATSNFNRIQESLKALKKFLSASSLKNWFAPAKNRSAIPLYFIAYNIFHSNIGTGNLCNMFDRFDTSDKNYHDMVVWLRLSLLNRVFSRGCGWIPYKTGIRKIHEIMSENKKKSFPSESLLSMYRDHPLHFTETVKTDNLDRFDWEFIFYLIYNGQLTIRNEDIDHIHPYTLLHSANIDEEKINSIVNYQLLDICTNRGIKNCKELYDWIENHIDAASRDGYISRHLIPDDPKLWKTKEFDSFYNARAILLAKKLQEQIK